MSKHSSIIARYRLIGFVFILAILWLFIKVLGIIFVDGPTWRKIAQTMHQPDTVTISPLRGNIISSDGHIVAISKPAYRLYLDFGAGSIQQLPQDSIYKQLDSLAYQMSLWEKGEQGTYQALRKRLREGYRKAELKKPGYRYVSICPYEVSHVEYQHLKQVYPLMMTVERKGRMVRRRGPLSVGLTYEERALRDRPYGELARRTIGSVYKEVKGDLTQGEYGLEQSFDTLLRGEPGLAVRQYLAGSTRQNTLHSPRAGYNVYTTLDMNLQQIVHRALYEQMTQFEADYGGAILMEVETGRIVALSNLTKSGESYYEGVNYALSALNEPGSTMKTPFMMAALDDGVCTPTDTIDTGNGVFKYGGYNIRDHNANRGGYGRISVAQGIWYSSNIVLAKIAIEGYVDHPEEIYKHLANYGLLERLDVGIEGVATPTVIRPEDKSYGNSTIPGISRGYGISVPAINTLNFYNGVANGGRIMRPYLVDRVEDADGKVIQEFQPQVLHENICKPATLDSIRSMLDNVVLKGTAARTVQSNLISISGKTGTALMSNHGGGGYRTSGEVYMTSFCGYFPSDRPKYSCIIFVVNPHGPGRASGGIVAGSGVKRIAEEIYTLSNPILLDTITPHTADMRLKHLELAGGKRKDVEHFLSAYGIPELRPQEGQKATSDQLVVPQYGHEAVQLYPLGSYSRGVMPRLVGLAPSEAVYQVSRQGLKVQLVGYGRVVGQSIPIGTPIKPGEKVILQLGNNHRQ